jgi:His/Glu/Gln/Arg/opine family amino acid ABC transporter permease subunit
MPRLDFAAVIAHWPLFLRGVGTTVLVSVVAMSIAVVLGLVIAGCQLAPIRPLRVAANLYVRVFRGIPLYVYIIWLYYGLALLLGVTLSPLQAGIIALSTLYAAYAAEIDRGGLLAVPRAQVEAAVALGLTPLQTFRDVVLPQAVRVVVPPTTSLFAAMLMDSSLLSVIGVMDLMRLVRVGASETFRSFEFYTAGALVYVALVLLVTRASAWLERRYRFER